MEPQEIWGTVVLDKLKTAGLKHRGAGVCSGMSGTNPGWGMGGVRDSIVCFEFDVEATAPL